MNGIKIKEKQVACVDRWVLKAVYIPNNIRRMLIESISNPIYLDGYAHYKFNDESIEYLSKECPIGFMQKLADYTISNKSLINTCKKFSDNVLNSEIEPIREYSRKIIIYKNKPYSTFKKFCELHNLKYNTWNKKDFPIMYDGNLIYKERLIK